jgi:prephenate dehydratase
MAARLYFKNEEVEIIPCMTFKEVFQAVKDDASVIAVAAIENTIAGSLLQNHDLIKESGLKIVGEHKLRIKQCICALPNQKIEDLYEVQSHPIALMQCDEYLDKHSNLKVVESEDTAGSAEMIARENLTGVAAICSSSAAEFYGLSILQDAIETNKRNFTRFLILANDSQVEELEKDKEKNKASLVFSVDHTPGALSKVLTIFSFYDISMTKIQSLPKIGKEWEYQFYIDLAYADYDRYKQSLDAIIPLTHEFQLLGEYAEGEQTV